MLSNDLEQSLNDAFRGARAKRRPGSNPDKEPKPQRGAIHQPRAKPWELGCKDESLSDVLADLQGVESWHYRLIAENGF